MESQRISKSSSILKSSLLEWFMGTQLVQAFMVEVYDKKEKNISNFPMLQNLLNRGIPAHLGLAILSVQKISFDYTKINIENNTSFIEFYGYYQCEDTEGKFLNWILTERNLNCGDLRYLFQVTKSIDNKKIIVGKIRNELLNLGETLFTEGYPAENIRIYFNEISEFVKVLDIEEFMPDKENVEKLKIDYLSKNSHLFEKYMIENWGESSIQLRTALIKYYSTTEPEKLSFSDICLILGKAIADPDIKNKEKDALHSKTLVMRNNTNTFESKYLYYKALPYGHSGKQDAFNQMREQNYMNEFNNIIIFLGEFIEMLRNKEIMPTKASFSQWITNYFLYMIELLLNDNIKDERYSLYQKLFIVQSLILMIENISGQNHMSGIIFTIKSKIKFLQTIDIGKELSILLKYFIDNDNIAPYIFEEIMKYPSFLIQNNDAMTSIYDLIFLKDRSWINENNKKDFLGLMKIYK